MHIDEYIDDYETCPIASWFFQLHRFPATLIFKFEEQIKRETLFCRYKGKVHRAVGCSSMGDVWLTTKLSVKSSNQYQIRCDISECSDFATTQAGTEAIKAGEASS